MEEARVTWSLPWHALQRTLAHRVIGDVARQYEVSRGPERAWSAAIGPNSWLVRAHNRAMPTHIPF
jgi:hypothetical protein